VIDWDAFVPLWEDGFTLADGPKTTAEARELYAACLQEVGDFAAREIAPHARAIDEEGVALRDGKLVQPQALVRNIEGLRRLGALAVNLPRDLGGLNFPMSVGAGLSEIVGRACNNTMLLHAFYQGPALLVLRYGTREQWQRWVKPLGEGQLSGSVAITEPDAGSDIGNLSTSAIQDGDHWRVSGRKQFITNGCGDVCIVLARTEPGGRGLDGLSLLVVPRLDNGRENFTVARPEKKFTIRGSATCELSFDRSCGELLGERGQGFRAILSFMNESRVGVAVQGLALSQAAFEAARGYASRRVQMGKPIAKHELVADMLLDMEADLAAMRALVYRCSALHDLALGLKRRGRANDLKRVARLERAVRDRTPLVKWFGSERTLWITRAAVQVHGGYGVVQEYEVERHYRDALILPIYEGTSQIQALMSLKDQLKWALRPPWRLLTGAVSVETKQDPLGDGVRDLAAEYNAGLRSVVGLDGVWAALSGRAAAGDGLAYAMLCAERLIAMLAYTRAAEALVLAVAGSASRRRLAERFVQRSLPLVKMHGEIVRSGDKSTLEALRA
jgi:alkylation response protein AidB-like acyl-CoA dehydrogenase